jgi:Glycosyltransferase sugar-binding region containing DXD motif
MGITVYCTNGNCPQNNQDQKIDGFEETNCPECGNLRDERIPDFLTEEDLSIDRSTLLQRANDALGLLSPGYASKLDVSLVSGFWKQVRIVEAFGIRSDQDLASEWRHSLPPEDVLIELESRMVHSIRVQGDPTEDGEFLTALKTRECFTGNGWTQMIWIYQADIHEYFPGTAVIGRQVNIDSVPLVEVNFKATIEQWDDMPRWVQDFIPILEVLFEKKSYVAMSDIMRLIILYFEGGLYLDTKILLTSQECPFLEEPKTFQHKLLIRKPRENWAMIAHAGCEQIEEIMVDTLGQFPNLDQLQNLPVNYADDGMYSGAHSKLHENRGPWNQVERKYGKLGDINAANPTLELTNPRGENSWSNNDGTTLADYEIE